MKIDIHTEARARLSLPTPLFFKTVQSRAAKTSAAFVGVTTLLASLATHLPSKLGFLSATSAAAAAFFGGVAALCSLAVEEPAAIPAAAAAVVALQEQQQPLAEVAE